MHSFLKSALAAAAIIGASIASASAQQLSQLSLPLIDQLHSQIASREANAPANEGNLLLHAELATLGDDGVRTTHLTGDWAGIITVTGFCEASCGDLDIAVLDSETGAEVVTDTGTNSTPIVTFRADQTRDYNLRVTMYNCAETLCYFVSASYFRSTD